MTLYAKHSCDKGGLFFTSSVKKPTTSSLPHSTRSLIKTSVSKSERLRPPLRQHTHTSQKAESFNSYYPFKTVALLATRQMGVRKSVSRPPPTPLS